MSKTVIEMAREAGVISTKIDGIERFAELVRADEREACAELCHWVVAEPGADVGTALMCVEKIRARGTHD